MNEEYLLCYPEIQDIHSWMKTIEIVRDIFPGLETEEKMEGIAPRALYKKYDFEEDELLIEFAYPSQKFICTESEYNLRWIKWRG